MKSTKRLPGCEKFLPHRGSKRPTDANLRARRFHYLAETDTTLSSGHRHKAVAIFFARFLPLPG